MRLTGIICIPPEGSDEVMEYGSCIVPHLGIASRVGWMIVPVQTQAVYGNIGIPVSVMS